MIHDRVHDNLRAVHIYVGTLELCMRHFLIQCITVDRLFTLKILNDRIASFNYGPDITNKPSKLSPHHLTPGGHIKQSGKKFLFI